MKLSNLSHSTLLKTLVCLKLLAILAPTGYPLIMPIMNAKEPSPRILNSGFMKMLNNLPKSRGISVFESSSVATKKG